MKKLSLVLAALCIAACEVHVEQETEVEYLQAPGLEDMDLPFSSAVRVGDTLYLSGSIGIVPGTRGLAEGAAAAAALAARLGPRPDDGHTRPAAVMLIDS